MDTRTNEQKIRDRATEMAVAGEVAAHNVRVAYEMELSAEGAQLDRHHERLARTEAAWRLIRASLIASDVSGF